MFHPICSGKKDVIKNVLGGLFLPSVQSLTRFQFAVHLQISAWALTRYLQLSLNQFYGAELWSSECIYFIYINCIVCRITTARLSMPAAAAPIQATVHQTPHIIFKYI